MTKEIIDPRDPNAPYDVKVSFSNQIRRDIMLQDLQHLIEHNNKELSVERLVGMYIGSIGDEGQRQNEVIDLVWRCDTASDTILKTGEVNSDINTDAAKILTIEMLQTKRLLYKNQIDYRIKGVHQPKTSVEQEEDKDFAYWVGYVFLNRPTWWIKNEEKYQQLRFDALDMVATAGTNCGMNLKDFNITQ